MPDAPTTTPDQKVPVSTPPEAAKAEGAAPPPKATPTAEAATSPPAQLSPQFAALAKKEKAILQRAQQLAEREKAMAAREEAIKRWEAVKSEAQLHPDKLLDEAGLDFAKVANYYLNEKKPTVDAELAKIKADWDAFQKKTAEEKEEMKKQAAEMAKKQEAETIATFKQQIGAFVDQNKESYELISLFGAHELIFKGIEDVFKQTGRVPSIKEAADGVQKYLEEQVETNLGKSKWFEQKYAPKAKEPVKETVTPDGSIATSQTLTNAMSPSTSGSTPAATEEERVRRALAALEQHAH